MQPNRSPLRWSSSSPGTGPTPRPAGARARAAHSPEPSSPGWSGNSAARSRLPAPSAATTRSAPTSASGTSVGCAAAWCPVRGPGAGGASVTGTSVGGAADWCPVRCRPARDARCPRRPGGVLTVMRTRPPSSRTDSTAALVRTTPSGSAATSSRCSQVRSTTTSGAPARASIASWSTASSGPPAAVAEATACRHRCRALPDGAAEPECVEGPDTVGHEPDARTGLPQLGTPLEHGHRMPGPVQGRRCGEPAQSGPDHHDVHATPYALRPVEGRLAPTSSTDVEGVT